MTAFVPTASAIGPATIFTSVAVGDSVTFLQPFTFFSTDNVAVDIDHASTSVVNMTTLMSGGSHAIDIAAVTSARITNTATGVIGATAATGAANGINTSTFGTAIFNDGHIFSSNGRGISSTGGNTTILNHGTIHGTAYGVYLNSAGYQLANHGTITGGTSAGAVYLGGSTGNRQLVNTGLIETVNAGTNAFTVHVVATGTTFIYNSGTIRSAVAIAVNAFTSTGGLYLENSGIVEGGAINLAIVGSNASDTIINSGYVNKSIDLADGDDIYDGRGGVVAGTVLGGEGNDTFRVSDTRTAILENVGEGTADRIESTVDYSLENLGEVEQLVLLGSAVQGIGNDFANLIEGNDMANVLLGLAGNDTITAGHGNDTAFGGEGADGAYGGSGNDSLHGGSGTDSLEGGDGDDVLRGGAGADRLFGGEGEDTLIGGVGRDFLSGGADADVFLFRTVADSGGTVKTSDTIGGFQPGLDKIDLSAIDAQVGRAGNQSFAFIGTAAFSGAAGEVRLVSVSGGVVLEGTINADTIADFSIRVKGVASLMVDDLIL